MPPGVHEELLVLGQALAALILGGLLGWERESVGKWAGLRTHMLVCLAAMLFVRLAQFLIMEAEASDGAAALRADPVRAIEAIATGIAFLGAGTIFRERQSGKPHGLTTAASLLATGSIGIAVAVNRYVIAIGVTLLVLFVLRVLGALETRREQSKPDVSPPVH